MHPGRADPGKTAHPGFKAPRTSCTGQSFDGEKSAHEPLANRKDRTRRSHADQDAVQSQTMKILFAVVMFQTCVFNSSSLARVHGSFLTVDVGGHIPSLLIAQRTWL